MSSEEDKILFEQLKQTAINMEKEIVCYLKAKNCCGEPAMVAKLTSVTNDLNKLAIKLHKMKNGDFDSQENGLKN